MKNRVISLRESRRSLRAAKQLRRPSLHDAAFCKGARDWLMSWPGGEGFKPKLLPTLPKVSPWRKAPTLDSLKTFEL